MFLILSNDSASVAIMLREEFSARGKGNGKIEVCWSLRKVGREELSPLASSFPRISMLGLSVVNRFFSNSVQRQQNSAIDGGLSLTLELAFREIDIISPPNANVLFAQYLSQPRLRNLIHTSLHIWLYFGGGGFLFGFRGSFLNWSAVRESCQFHRIGTVYERLHTC